MNDNYNYPHNFLSENVLTELVTAEDLEIILEEQKYLETERRSKKYFSALKELIWLQN